MSEQKIDEQLQELREKILKRRENTAQILLEMIETLQAMRHNARHGGTY